MRFSCDNCASQYTIADAKVRGKVLKIRCKKCAHAIIVRDRSSGQEGALGSNTPQGQRRAPSALADDQRWAPRPTQRTRAPMRQVAEPEEGPQENTMITRVPAEMLRQLQERGERPTWFVAMRRRPIGPITHHDVIARIRGGELLPESLVWRTGWPEWMPAVSIDIFHEVFLELEAAHSAPPPLPSGASAYAQEPHYSEQPAQHLGYEDEIDDDDDEVPTIAISADEVMSGASGGLFAGLLAEAEASEILDEHATQNELSAAVDREALEASYGVAPEPAPVVRRGRGGRNVVSQTTSAEQPKPSVSDTGMFYNLLAEAVEAEEQEAAAQVPAHPIVRRGKGKAVVVEPVAEKVEPSTLFAGLLAEAKEDLAQEDAEFSVESLDQSDAVSSDAEVVVLPEEASEKEARLVARALEAQAANTSLQKAVPSSLFAGLLAEAEETGNASAPSDDEETEIAAEDLHSADVTAMAIIAATPSLAGISKEELISAGVLKEEDEPQKATPIPLARMETSLPSLGDSADLMDSLSASVSSDASTLLQGLGGLPSLTETPAEENEAPQTSAAASPMFGGLLAEALATEAEQEAEFEDEEQDESTEAEPVVALDASDAVEPAVAALGGFSEPDFNAAEPSLELDLPLEEDIPTSIGLKPLSSDDAEEASAAVIRPVLEDLEPNVLSALDIGAQAEPALPQLPSLDELDISDLLDPGAGLTSPLGQSVTPLPESASVEEAEALSGEELELAVEEGTAPAPAEATQEDTEKAAPALVFPPPREEVAEPASVGVADEAFAQSDLHIEGERSAQLEVELASSAPEPEDFELSAPTDLGLHEEPVEPVEPALEASSEAEFGVDNAPQALAVPLLGEEAMSPTMPAEIVEAEPAAEDGVLDEASLVAVAPTLDTPETDLSDVPSGPSPALATPVLDALEAEVPSPSPVAEAEAVDAPALAVEPNEEDRLGLEDIPGMPPLPTASAAAPSLHEPPSVFFEEEEAKFFEEEANAWEKNDDGMVEFSLPPLPPEEEEEVFELHEIDDEDIIEIRDSMKNIKSKWYQKVAVLGGISLLLALFIIPLAMGSEFRRFLGQKPKERRTKPKIRRTKLGKKLTAAQLKAQRELLGTGPAKTGDIPDSLEKKLNKVSKRRGYRRRVVRAKPTKRSGNDDPMVALLAAQNNSRVMRGLSQRLRAAGFQKRKATGVSSGAEGVDPTLMKRIVGEIDRNRSKVRYCYEQYLKVTTVSGLMKVQLDILRSGRVRNVKVQTKRFRGLRISRCITTFMKRWRFQPFSGRPYLRLEIPYLLKVR